MLAILLLVAGVALRLIPHVPNFTPVIAVALFGGAYLSNKQSILLPVVLLAVTDIILGFHNTMFYTWGSVILISFLGRWLKNHKTALNIIGAGFGASIIFFVITNLGVWLAGSLYPLTFVGLSDCFVLAVPFFKTEVLSTFVYSFLLFGSYEFLAARIKNTKLAFVL